MKKIKMINLSITLLVSLTLIALLIYLLASSISINIEKVEADIYVFKKIEDNMWSFNQIYEISSTGDVSTKTSSTVYIVLCVMLTLSIIMIISTSANYFISDSKIGIFLNIPITLIFIVFMSIISLIISKINAVGNNEVWALLEGKLITGAISFFYGDNNQFLKNIATGGNGEEAFFPFMTSNDNVKFTSLPTTSGMFISLVSSIPLLSVGVIYKLFVTKHTFSNE